MFHLRYTQLLLTSHIAADTGCGSNTGRAKHFLDKLHSKVTDRQLAEIQTTDRIHKNLVCGVNANIVRRYIFKINSNENQKVFDLLNPGFAKNVFFL